jgi:hypothetical protein
VAGEQLGAVLDAFLLASQPRERYKQGKFKKNSEFQTCRAHLAGCRHGRMAMVN